MTGDMVIVFYPLFGQKMHKMRNFDMAIFTLALLQETPRVGFKDPFFEASFARASSMH